MTSAPGPAATDAELVRRLRAEQVPHRAELGVLAAEPQRCDDRTFRRGECRWD